jgi:dTDP-glucose 4,6-dehydratase
MTERILVTGGAGFIGSNFIKMLLNRSDDVFVVNLDALTYAGNPANLSDLENNSRYRFVHGSIQNNELVEYIINKFQVTGIINFAAESHVDRSILNSQPFIDTNIAGTMTLLDSARKYRIKAFLQVSTDEVYGSLGAEGKFSESTPLSPNSPYSASKASADMLVMASYHTFGLPVIITRCSNNYGQYQFPEKLIPLMIINALEGKKLPVYGDGLNVRDWIHVDDHCNAIWQVYNSGKSGEVYNIGANCEQTNISIVKNILNVLNLSEELIEYVKDRPGHDRRYAIDSSKIEKEIGWKPKKDFESAIEDTIEWYITNKHWWQNIRSGAYLEYYSKQYGIHL